MKIITIVPTFNRCELFKEAFFSVMAQTSATDLFLILDNGCTDGTSAFLDSQKSDRVRVYRNEKNSGASAGMHFLLKKAQEFDPDWIWIMDDDGKAFPDALEALTNSEEIRNSDTYILESLIVDEKGQWSKANQPAVFSAKDFAFTGIVADDSAAPPVHPVSVHTGGYCGMLIRRQALEEFGLPNPDFYLWYDDVEFVVRVTRQKKAFLMPASKIQHFAQALVEHETRWPFSGPLPKVPEKLLWRYYYLNRNYLWFAKQYLSAPRFLVFFAKQMARNLATPVLLKQDQLARRTKLALRAGFDAIFNRLGQRVSPK